MGCDERNHVQGKAACDTVLSQAVIVRLLLSSLLARTRHLVRLFHYHRSCLAGYGLQWYGIGLLSGVSSRCLYVWGQLAATVHLFPASLVAFISDSQPHVGLGARFVSVWLSLAWRSHVRSSRFCCTRGTLHHSDHCQPSHVMQHCSRPIDYYHTSQQHDTSTFHVDPHSDSISIRASGDFRPRLVNRRLEPLSSFERLHTCIGMASSAFHSALAALHECALLSMMLHL